MVKVELENGDEVAAQIRAIPDQLQAAIGGRLGAEAERVAERVRANASGGVVRERTGTLAGSVAVQAVETEGGKSSVAITAAGGDAWYGKVLERGTKAFEERGRFRPAGTLSKKGRKLKARAGAHAMKFVAGGSTVFAKVVEHPEIARRPWFTGALESLEDSILRGLAETVADVVEGK